MQENIVGNDRVSELLLCQKTWSTLYESVHENHVNASCQLTVYETHLDLYAHQVCTFVTKVTGCDCYANRVVNLGSIDEGEYSTKLIQY